MKKPIFFDGEEVQEILEELIKRAKDGESIVIRDGPSMVKIEPINEAERWLPAASAV
jgi:hypothetical protein